MYRLVQKNSYDHVHTSPNEHLEGGSYDDPFLELGSVPLGFPLEGII
jgi:hypothetical protein